VACSFYSFVLAIDSNDQSAKEHLLFMLMLASKVKARLYKAGERTLLLSTSSARWRLGEEPIAMLA